MAAFFSWAEDNGAAAGDPAKGTTRASGITNVNWKNTDDTATAYSSSPITAGNNSYTKYQFGVFQGPFNQISNAKFSHWSGTLGAGLSLWLKTGSGYATPATSSLAGAVDFTATGDPATGHGPICFGTVGPERASGFGAGAGTLAFTGYTTYLATQLRTTEAASAGDTATCTLALRYDENG